MGQTWWPSITLGVVVLSCACHTTPTRAAGAAVKAQALSRAGQTPTAKLALWPSALGYRPLSDPSQEPQRFLLRTTEGARLLSAVRPAQPNAIAHPRGIIVGLGSLPDTVEPWHLRPSSVVDFDQPEVAALARQLPVPATLQSLRSIVANYFTEEVHGQFLAASASVQRRGGDCTEQAVLAAALARAAGLPARVVVGYALLPEASPPIAQGHVWTQIFDGEAWQTLDPSPIAKEGRQYLLMGTLRDEGPDYRVEVVQQVVDGVEAL